MPDYELKGNTMNADLKANAKWAKDIGKQAEDAVLSLFLARGYALLARNYLVHRYGELDLILGKDMCIYVVEVKSRRDSDSFGGAREAITSQKKTRMLRATRVFLLDRQWESFDIRFVAGCVTHRTDGSILAIEILSI